MQQYESEHYIFHYAAGTKAEQDIAQIVATQEAGYRHICLMLGLSVNKKIHYYLYNSPEDIGKECERRFGDYTPYNGCTVSESEILAVYNEEVQCIGNHEDTHILMFSLGFSKSSFLEEGIACAMDQLWWGIDNTAWVSFYRKHKKCPSVKELLLLSREDFYSMDCMTAYPLAGSFAAYLLMRISKDAFHQLYLANNLNLAIQEILGCSLAKLEEDYFQYVDFLHYDEGVYALIEGMLREYNS